MDLSGDLEDVIDNLLPHEMTHLLMAEHFQRRIPTWVDEGMAVIAESTENQRMADRRCRSALEQGRCFRLAALFDQEDPSLTGDKWVQAHSVVRFLLSRKSPVKGFRVQAEDPQHRTHYELAAREGALLFFIRKGMEDGWDKAAKEYYGVENVAALEMAWIEWMKTKESRIEPPDPSSGRPCPRRSRRLR